MKESRIILIFLVAVFSLMFLSKAGVFIGLGDEASHSLAAMFYSDFARFWIGSPTFSVGEMFDFAIEYQTLYKAMGTMRHWPPLQHWLMGASTFIFGKSVEALRIPGLIESTLILLLTFLISRKMFDQKRILMPLIAAFFVLFNPIFFHYGPATGIDLISTLTYTATFFFLFMFLKTDDKRYFYLMTVSMALGIMGKQTMAILLPLILLSLIVEKREFFSLKNKGIFLKSFMIFILILSPYYIFMESVFLSIGFQGIENTVLRNVVNTEVGLGQFTLARDVMLMNNPPIWEPISKLTSSLSAVFYQFLLLPFFILFLWKAPRKNGYWSALFFSMSFVVFFTLFSHVELRYLLPCIPIATVLAVRGLFQMQDLNKIRILFKPVLVILMAAAMIFTFEYVSTMNAYDTAENKVFAADYVIANTDEPASVVAFRREIWGFVFDIKGIDYIYVMKPAHYNRGGVEVETNLTDEEELAIMLESEGYVERPSKPSWNRTGFNHPPIQWVLISEQQILAEKYNFETGRTIKEFMDEREDFELVKVVNGNLPENRIFIFERVYPSQ